MLAVWIGLSLVVALVALNLDVRDRMNVELRSFGANIKVEPIESSIPVRIGGNEIASATEASTLSEGDIDGLGDIFWRNNILGVCGRLWTHARVDGQKLAVLGVTLDRELPSVGGATLVTGARQLYTHWAVDGEWPSAGSTRECLVGRDAAASLGVGTGDQINVTTPGGATAMTVTGIVTTGGREDGAIIATLPFVQSLSGLAGRISEADISALTTPENKLAEKYNLDPKALAPAEYERWVCTPFPGSVANNIQEAIPGSAARVVRRVTETQGAVLGRIGGLMLFLAAVTLITCVLSVHGVLTSAVEERRFEMALMRAIGAHRGNILLLFLVEASILGIVGGLLAAGTGSVIGQMLSKAVFGTAPDAHPVLALLAPVLGLLIAWWGSYWTVRRVLRQDTAHVLHGS